MYRALWAGLLSRLADPGDAHVAIARTHVLERVAFLFPTLLQVAAPLVATVIAAFAWPGFGKAMSDVARGVSSLELVAIHALRLAAWGTVAKHRKQQLPRCFFHYGAIPDFAFALRSIALGFLMWMDIVVPSQSVLVVWSVLGIAGFFRSGISMYFGVETGILGWRWKYVVAKAEPPTLRPPLWGTEISLAMGLRGALIAPRGGVRKRPWNSDKSAIF